MIWRRIESVGKSLKITELRLRSPCGMAELDLCQGRDRPGNPRRRRGDPRRQRTRGHGGHQATSHFTLRGKTPDESNCTFAICTATPFGGAGSSSTRRSARSRSPSGTSSENTWASRFTPPGRQGARSGPPTPTDGTLAPGARRVRRVRPRGRQPGGIQRSSGIRFAVQPRSEPGGLGVCDRMHRQSEGSGWAPSRFADRRARAVFPPARR